jgi:antitoxin PrlF
MRRWQLDPEPGLPYDLGVCKEYAMIDSTITAKGQTTVPKEVRDKLGAKPGTKLRWHLMPDGTLIVRAKTRSILDLAGSIKAPKGKRVSIEDMNPWR